MILAVSYEPDLETRRDWYNKVDMYPSPHTPSRPSLYLFPTSPSSISPSFKLKSSAGLLSLDLVPGALPISVTPSYTNLHARGEPMNRCHFSCAALEERPREASTLVTRGRGGEKERHGMVGRHGARKSRADNSANGCKSEEEDDSANNSPQLHLETSVLCTSPSPCPIQQHRKTKSTGYSLPRCRVLVQSDPSL